MKEARIYPLLGMGATRFSVYVLDDYLKFQKVCDTYQEALLLTTKHTLEHGGVIKDYTREDQRT